MRYAIHLDVVAQKFAVLDAEPFEKGGLEAFAGLFPENPPGETTLDVTIRTVAGTEVAIFCDDEGLLRKDSILSAVTRDGRPILVGSLLILAAEVDLVGSLLILAAEVDRDGGNVGLAEDVAKTIVSAAMGVADTGDGPRLVLVLDPPAPLKPHPAGTL